jgi:uncharacterized membrane protein HdeD (DUF308 family)
MSAEWIALGVIMIFLGFLAIIFPVATTIRLAVILAAILIVSGVVQGVNAFRFRSERGGPGRFIGSLLALLAGIVILRDVRAGVVGIGVLFTFYFFANAAGKWVLAAEIRPLPGWQSILLSGIASFILGVIMLLSFPFSSFVFPAIVLGVELIFSGMTVIAYASTRGKPPLGFEEPIEKRQAA